MIFGTQISVKLSGAASGGTHAIMELVTPAQSGPPMHLHQREDQTFYVLEGQYRFEVDGKRIPAGPGSAVYVPGWKICSRSLRKPAKASASRRCRW